MIKLYNSFVIFFITIFLIGCNNQHQQKTILFNSNWQFVRLDDKGIAKVNIENQGTGWKSQYNVTHVVSEGNLGLDKDIVNSEFKLLESADWQSISIPHTPKIEDLTVLKQWQGICYYKKEFIADNNWKDQISYIEFEGAMHLADIWINGKHVMQHAGGYTPFVIDVSNNLKFGESNEIVVRLDNRNNELIPPGKPVDKLDFNYYGGIYRDVNFIIKNKIHITHPILANEVGGGGVFVTYPKVTDQNAVVAVKTQIINELDKNCEVEVHQRLLTINGLFQERNIGVEIGNTKTILNLSSGESKHVKQNINVKQPQLWSPDAPYLYLLKTEVLQNGKIIDSEERRIGIRSIAFTKKNGFEINGTKLRLEGSNRHMEYPYIGNAISDLAQYRDIYHIKESGFNTVRLGHYVQDKSVLEACDELGLLAIEPIPGWQFFNENEQFCELTYRDIKHMIRRDRNHPSIIMWEVILNEAWPPNWWKDKAYNFAKAEYPGNQFFVSGDSYGYYGWDVQYNDWEEGFKRPNISEKAGFIREYYDYEFGGHYSTTRVKRGDGEKALLQNAWNAQWSHNRYRAQYPQTAGDAVWSMYDYNRGCCDNICRSGIADIFRIDKFSVPFYKSQMSIGTPLPSGIFKPYVFIANYWDNQLDNNKLVVYSNTEEVVLEINGKQVARQQSDKGMDSDYGNTKEMWYNGGNPFDGGNGNNLEKAPFTFNNIKWEKGTVKAIGYVDGKALTEYEISTPIKASKLSIDYFESGKKASINDLLIVYVKIKDLNGTLCINDSSSILLEVIEGGEIVGPNTVEAEAGIASFIVKTHDVGQLEINAKSDFDHKSIKWNLY
ncbi:DUF4982 domain-containing protein [Lutibacter sp. A64]|uniref:glycoside hydrolase family 2 TIM barrel-domain containing protein n=1 Tax=Lutibacter sp. A64 TaxID=2918526 RepID=UPI001F062F12|nr:glycoside hydrolase family 2 TIM barrel-domain containing protein [Lutibacter sp. A64]UMB52400.1 DUF4982 domain-containing protein [Lutibacter sp. A64]